MAVHAMQESEAMAETAHGPSAGMHLRRARLEMRLTDQQKRLLERAAALRGQTLSHFVLAAAQDVARRAVEDHQRLDLSLRDAETFVAALLRPPPAAPRLRETVRRYRMPPAPE
jgi:uncharacterized protein (DUF1778 family)